MLLQFGVSRAFSDQSSMKKHHFPVSASELSLRPKGACSTPALFLVPISLMTFIFLVVHPNEFWLQSLASGRCEPRHSVGASTEHFVGNVTSAPELRILIGILTKPVTYERRHLLRNVYAMQPNVTFNAQIDVFFVFCNLTKEEDRVLVALEIMRYDDVIILNCTENVNDGKTFSYFTSLPGLFKNGTGEKPYDYVIKTDDDSYVRLDPLAQTLREMPREDLYLGFHIPCNKVTDLRGWMTGMLYALSWDLVEWILESDIPRNKKGHHRLGEDVVLAHWLKDGKKGKNRVDMNPRMYDIYAENKPCVSMKFRPDTLVVHRLKSNQQWATTLAYFNVTQGLKPSKFYHIY